MFKWVEGSDEGENFVGGLVSYMEAFSDPWLAQASLWLTWAPK